MCYAQSATDYLNQHSPISWLVILAWQVLQAQSRSVRSDARDPRGVAISSRSISTLRRHVTSRHVTSRHVTSRRVNSCQRHTCPALRFLFTTPVVFCPSSSTKSANQDPLLEALSTTQTLIVELSFHEFFSFVREFFFVTFEHKPHSTLKSLINHKNHLYTCANFPLSFLFLTSKTIYSPTCPPFCREN